MSTDMSLTADPEILHATRRTILLVEDDEAVRRFIRTVLHHGGYEVAMASDGDEALALYCARPNGIDLVLTDVVMPNRTGPALVKELRRITPGLSVIFMSGYTGGTASTAVEMPPDATLIEKPFSIERLLRTIAESLLKRV